MFDLKPLNPEAIPRALERAERYRFLAEPAQAESICLDVLQIDPDNQQAVTTLLLALTQELDQGISEYAKRARELLPRLHAEYDRAYYAGIIAERQARAFLNMKAPGTGEVAERWLYEAMSSYEKAEAVRPPGNDDALLRWNTCVRMLRRALRSVPTAEGRFEAVE